MGERMPYIQNISLFNCRLGCSGRKRHTANSIHRLKYFILLKVVFTKYRIQLGYSTIISIGCP